MNAANNTATNTDTFVRTYGHETAHDYTQNESVADNAGSYAKSIFNILNILSFDNINSSGNATSKDWLGNQFSNVNTTSNLLANTMSAKNVNNRSNLTIYIEGTDLTGNRNEKESREHSLEMAGLASDTFNNDSTKKTGTIFWKGGNTKEDRTDTAYKIFEYVSNYEFAEGEPFNIVGHSHGGNVIKEFTNIYVLPQEITNFNNLTGANVGNMNYTDKAINYKTIDKAVLDGTPHRSDYNFNFNVMTPGEKPIAVSDKNDIITQDVLGGTDYKDRTQKQILNSIVIGKPDTSINPSKTMDGAINITIEQTENKAMIRMTPVDYINWFNTGNRPQQSVGPIDSHTGLNTPETWKNHIDPAIKNINNNSNK